MLAPLAAVLVDRHRRDRILLAVCVVRALALTGAALSLGVFASPLPAYALAAVSEELKQQEEHDGGSSE